MFLLFVRVKDSVDVPWVHCGFLMGASWIVDWCTVDGCIVLVGVCD